MHRSVIIPVVLTFILGACAGSSSTVTPPKKLEPVKNTFAIKRIWQENLGEGASDNYLRLTPVIKDSILYSSHFNGTVNAYNTRTKHIVWTYDTNTKIGSPVTLQDGKLYFGTSKGEVFALLADTGKLIWRSTVASEVIAAPAASERFVVVRCVNGELVTLDASNGKQVWSNYQLTPSLTLRGTSAPVIYNDIVLSAFDNGKLIAYNLQSGRILWQKNIAIPRGRSPLERIVDIDADIVVANDIVYTTSFQGNLSAIHIGSGQDVWSRDIGTYIGIAVDSYRLYIADSESRIWALDKNNGATLWKQDALLARGLSKPLLHSGYVVVGDFNGFMHWIGVSSGKLEARSRLKVFEYNSPDLDEVEDLNYPKTNDILATPITDGNVLIAMDRHGHTEAFEISYP